VAIEGEGERPVVLLRDSCLAVSSPAGREVEGGGRRLGHIIDPRTGEPAACARVACVTGRSAALCDAWAKPALIEGGRPRGLPAGYAVRIHDEDRWLIEGPGGAQESAPAFAG
jgi:thiamine biosynthesis lipoprotein ApbE